VKAGHLTRILGEQLSLREVTARAVDAFIDRRLDEGAARNTIHKELTVLRGALKVAKRRGEFTGDIAAVMPDGFSTEYKPRERFLTAREAQAMLAQLEPDRAARVAFILATGARWGESERARLQDIDMDRGLVLLRGTKTKTSACFVPVVGFSVPLLEHALEHRQGDGGLLFRPWGNVRRDLAAACARAGLANCTPNDLTPHLRHLVAGARGGAPPHWFAPRPQRLPDGRAGLRAHAGAVPRASTGAAPTPYPGGLRRLQHMRSRLEQTRATHETQETRRRHVPCGIYGVRGRN
jgi:integrase